MLLALDIGNTTIAGGIFDGARLAHDFHVETDRAAADGSVLAEAVGKLIGRITAAVAGSVVPRVNEPLAASVKRLCGVPLHYVRKEIPLPIELAGPHPDQVGDDRLASAVAAYRRARGAAFVVDFGTAVTVDAVSQTGAYLGGVIAPGIRLAAKALHEGTALLPPVEIEAPETILGTTTRAAMQSGLTHGIASMVDGLVAKLRRELGLTAAPVYATGGQAQLIAGLMETPCEVVGALTLEGLRIAYQETAMARGARTL